MLDKQNKTQNVADMKRHFVINYAVAIMLIIVISVSAYIYMERAIIAEENGAEIVNLSGKQRTHVRTIYAVASLQSSELSNPQRTAQLATSLNDLETAHARLYAHIASGVNDQEAHQQLRALFEEPVVGLNDQVDEFTSKARRFLDGGSLTPSELTELEAMAFGTLFVAVNNAVTLFQADVEAGIERIRLVHFLHLIAIITILFAEAVFIFWPLLKRTLSHIRRQKETYDALKSAVDFHNATFASQKRFNSALHDCFIGPISQARENLVAATRNDPSLGGSHLHKAHMALLGAEHRMRELEGLHKDMREVAADKERVIRGYEHAQHDAT